jgi:hypothetical protein
MPDFVAFGKTWQTVFSTSSPGGHATASVSGLEELQLRKKS